MRGWVGGGLEPIHRGIADLIPAWSLLLAPDSKEVKIEVDEGKVNSDWAEVVPLPDSAARLRANCRFFLLPPKRDETPSAFFAVGPAEKGDDPNMVYVSLVVQSTVGCTIPSTPTDFAMAENLRPLAQAVSRPDTAMGFTLKVLVNCVALTKGDILTKARVEKPKKEKDDIKPVLAKQVLKRLRPEQADVGSKSVKRR